MRILQVVKSLKKNGTETLIMNLFRNLPRDEFMFDFLISDNDKEGYYDEAVALGAKIYHIPSRGKNPLKYYRNLKQFFKQHQGEYNAVHINDMSASSVAPLYYAKKIGIPVRIMHFHGSNCHGIHNKILHKINKRHLKNLATNYLACSSSAKEWGYSNTPALPGSKVLINGIDPSRFKYDKSQRSRIRKDLFYNENHDVLIHIGTFNKIKNHSFLLEIFSHGVAQNPNLRMILIGDGPLLESTKKHADKLGIQHYIHFLGRQENISPYLSAADCFILPSMHEGLPMVALEAQASGLPLIVSTGVTQEAKASEFFSRISLKDEIQIWVDEIQKFMRIKNKDRNIPPELNNFSIEKTVEVISEIYRN